MPSNYKIWRITYNYTYKDYNLDTDGHNEYVVIAENENEAKNKADDEFMHTNEYLEYHLTLYYNVFRQIKEIKAQKIQMPKLSLTKDWKNFDLVARVTDDGNGLEFIVEEKKQ